MKLFNCVVVVPPGATILQEESADSMEGCEIYFLDHTTVQSIIEIVKSRLNTLAASLPPFRIDPIPAPHRLTEERN